MPELVALGLIDRAEELRKSLYLIAQAQDSYSAIMAGTTQEALEQNKAILNLATGIGQYENMYTTGQITLLEYIRVTDALTESLRVLTEAAGLAGSAVSMVQFNVPTMAQVSASRVMMVGRSRVRKADNTATITGALQSASTVAMETPTLGRLA